MRAITIHEPGGPEVLTWAEVPDPTAGPGEVLVEVVASAVNRADLLQRQGHYNPPPGSSPYPGLECAGLLDGEPVCALLSGGGYAQRVAVPADHLLPVPAGVALDEAAGLPEVACTVWSNVVRGARLAEGETLLVHGGSSGIGTFAIQLGKALGARVITTARKVKHEALLALGADHVIDYSTEDFVEVTQGLGGADVILDIIAASYLDRNIAALASNGRIATIGTQGGRRAELDFRKLMAKRGSISATTLRARPAAEKTAIIAGVRETVWPLIEAGRIRPVIDRRLPMARAADAHRVVEENEHIGKVLLVNPS
ncbi:NAD(P)H quinone oxidoreductase [Asanoa ishikariensis]|uniref:Putative NAD(P)H quinone oxidoreductase, PIG3 family n=1 Tax=Asanoa ishikariensis TaxID=137265 RepID=A0A1H3KQJ2_9ACTN|nr:NAD(P)H-quinone oxidoreductase [Asanoa ishikariensis]GIF69772.1 NAD(P)H quinone oxidoreductase [Asanoa ishikariensis]SDY53944.1 putative NAD(P)H quinone oxidoreductase, PIG3 family [Asanoa ishikariensis]